jgi:hypothetical protein
VITDLESAFHDLLAALGESSDFLRAHPFYDDEENRASGYAFLVSVLLARLEEDVISDAEFPFFRVIDRRTREGADNPDQRYLVALVMGGKTYRIWGKLGSARRLEFQVYAGDPYLSDGGRSASFLTFEDLTVGDDGSFEVFLSPQKAGTNWLENPDDATKLFVRQVYSEWTDDPTGEVHIDLVGSEGSPMPRLTEEELARRLHKAAIDLRSHVKIWPHVVGHVLEGVAPNELAPPLDSGAQGGVPGRWMVQGTFELDDDEALIVRTWPSSGNYQGIQLLDLWLESLEYANRQTSLTGDQAQLSDDGSYYLVISARDPGVANWLDTMGRRRGVMLLRYDGTTEEAFDPRQWPTTTKVKFAELASHLPPDTASRSPADRIVDIAARRKHVQIRFGN